MKMKETTRFDWDPAKDQANRRKHGVSFEIASLVFEDQWIFSRRDLSHDEAEERYNALGEIAPGIVLFVVYTCCERGSEEVIRLISARKASAHERKTYEEAHRSAEPGHRRPRRKDRRGD
jgi:uncharacterized DUF497 family protein